jgi:hypothetical protein
VHAHKISLVASLVRAEKQPRCLQKNHGACQTDESSITTANLTRPKHQLAPQSAIKLGSGNCGSSILLLDPHRAGNRGVMVAE